jgi:hypothetical protein
MRYSWGPPSSSSVASCAPDQAGQKLPHDHVLVVPGGGSPRLLEERVLGRLVLAQAVDQPVVQLDEGDGHLAGEQVHVVAWIPDERDPS